MPNSLSVYLEQEILSASPLQLVHLLYQAAISQIRDARRHLSIKNVAARCAAISKACDILGELRSSLDREAGAQIAESLESLYNYMLSRLLDANLHQDDAPMAEVLGLLNTLDEAWKQIAENPRAGVPCDFPDSLATVPANAFALADAADRPAFSFAL